MKVYFHKNGAWNWTPTRLPQEENLLALSFNNWDDYGVSTTLNAVLYHEKKPILEFSLKLLIDGDKYSPKKLNELREQGWDGFFPILNTNYVSVPSDIEFYDALISKLGTKEAISVLLTIRDAGYLTNVIKDEKALTLVSNADFSTSPLREAGARKAYADGWKAFSGEEAVINIQDFTLYTPRRDLEGVDEIRFRFNSNTLPYDINVLIGPNGIGKSHTLKKLVDYWVGMDAGSQTTLQKTKHKPFDVSPNISRLVLISYSPFEDFALDLSKTKLKDKTAYKYFGFRKSTVSPSGKRRVGISRNLPATDSVDSILKAYEDDSAFDYLSGWTSKSSTIWEVLQPALGFDKIALKLNSDNEIPSSYKKYLFDYGDNKYFELSRDSFDKLKKLIGTTPNVIAPTEGVVFLKNNRQINLSSGQRLFVYMVINIVGQIKSESLVVVDEPELFLHPTFEIEFIALLKKVLAAFSSKAILATHSLAIAREIPANCMHVYRYGEVGIEIDHPPFETFGGDMQRISSYVFADNRSTKPYAQWIAKKIKETENPKDLLKQLKGELNEELTIKILNSGPSHGC